MATILWNYRKVTKTEGGLTAGEHEIRIRLTQNREPKYISVGYSSSVELWDEASQLPLPGHPRYKQIVQKITSLLNDIDFEIKLAKRNGTGITQHTDEDYSVLSVFIGLAIAALIAWKLTVTREMNIAITPANPKIHHSISIRYAYSCNQVCIAHQAKGDAISNAIMTNNRNSLDNKENKEKMLAPSTFRIPISRVLCSAVNMANPNKPRQEMKMASSEKQLVSRLTMASLLYNF